MSHTLTLLEFMEIRELLSFKNRSLIQSELFLRMVEGQHDCSSLEADIEFSVQEVTELKDLLFYSAT